LAAVYDVAGIPRCDCGGIIKPDVVLYEEPPNRSDLVAAARAIAAADMLIIGGTSLVVYPAAALVDYFQGDRLAVIDTAADPRDRSPAHLVITDPIAQVFASLR
jgi:NAD-dependent deacetylase